MSKFFNGLLLLDSNLEMAFLKNRRSDSGNLRTNYLNIISHYLSVKMSNGYAAKSYIFLKQRNLNFRDYFAKKNYKNYILILTDY